MHKYAGYFNNHGSLLPVLVSLLQFYEATDHLFHGDGDPKTGYEYDDNADAWDAMANLREAARQAIETIGKRRQPDG